jgi:DNA replication protein DnaC
VKSSSEADIPKESLSKNVVPECSYRESENVSSISIARGEQTSLSHAPSETMKRVEEKRDDKVTPRCAVCGESILADEPLGGADADQWTLYNATHDRLCLKHFRVEYEKLKRHWRLQDVERRLVCAGVSVAFSNRSFENFVVNESNRRLFTLVKNWSDHPYSFMSIMSQHSGIGKTHLAIAALRQQYIATGNLGRFRKERDVLLQIRKGYANHGNPSEGEIIESLSKPDFLVLDDLFSFNDTTDGTEFARRIALATIDEREWQARTTILTSNITLSDISAIDTRIASRLSGGLVLNVQSVDKDFRPTLAEASRAGGPTLYRPALSLSKDRNLEKPNE